MVSDQAATPQLGVLQRCATNAADAAHCMPYACVDKELPW